MQDIKIIAKNAVEELVSLMEQHDALPEFAKYRAKFEGWVKVELLGILQKLAKTEVVPEMDRHDLVMGDYCAIELKTTNTNYRIEGVLNKTRPITRNIESIIEDVEKLKKSKYPFKMMVFVVFPLSNPEKPEWKGHLSKLKPYFEKLEEKPFKFKNGIPAVLYYGFPNSK